MGAKKKKKKKKKKRVLVEVKYIENKKVQLSNDISSLDKKISYEKGSKKINITEKYNSN